MRLPAFSATFLFLLLAATATAQSVWVVDDDGGPGVDFTQISFAVNAAGEGDLVLVRDGTYLNFVVNGKSITVVADRGAQPIINVYALIPIWVHDLAPGQEVYLRGLRFVGTFFHFSEPFPAPSILIEDCAGEVWVEDCLFKSLGPTGSLGTAIDVNNCAGVNVTRCDITSNLADVLAFGSAISSRDSTLAVYDSILRGGRGFRPYFNSNGAGHGLRVVGGTIFVAGSVLQGGDGEALLAGAGATDGGDGLNVEGGAVVHVRDSSLAGGLGGTPTAGGSAGSPGVPTELISGSVTPVVSDARSMVIDSPVRSGTEPIVQTFTGNPGDLVYIMYSAVGQAPGNYIPVVHGAMVIDPTVIYGHVVGTIGPSGVLVDRSDTVSTAIAGFEQISAQASFVNGVLGGNLSSPSHLVLLSDTDRPLLPAR